MPDSLLGAGALLVGTVGFVAVELCTVDSGFEASLDNSEADERGPGGDSPGPRPRPPARVGRVRVGWGAVGKFLRMVSGKLRGTGPIGPRMPFPPPALLPRLPPPPPPARLGGSISGFIPVWIKL